MHLQAVLFILEIRNHISKYLYVIPHVHKTPANDPHAISFHFVMVFMVYLSTESSVVLTSITGIMFTCHKVADTLYLWKV